MKNLFARFVLTAILGSLFPSSTSAQNLFVASSGGGKIYEFTPGGTQSIFASNLTEPTGLAFNSAGVLFEVDYVGGNTTGKINEFMSNGTPSTFASGLHSSFALAFDSAGVLFEADSSSGIIYKFAADGTKTVFATGLSSPDGLAFNSAGDLFEADGGNKIYEFTPDGTKSTFVSGLDEPSGLAFNSAGDLFEADQGSGKIYEFTPGGTRSTFATGLSPIGLAFDSLGNLFEADSGIIYKFTSGGTQSTFVSGLNDPTQLTFQPLVTAFSALTANKSITYGASAITLAGTVSAAGPVYPAQGETITITINGNAQTTTINNSTGRFSLSYNPSTIPVSATPYTITYAYGGDNWLLAQGSYLSATTKASTTLTVNTATPSFSNLTASQIIPNDTAAITLGGTVSASGPVYPAQGETITVSINGNAQTTTINDTTGDFSFSYNPSTIPMNIAPYVITYSYAGDANFNAAPNNTNTTLTVYLAQNLFESDLGSQQIYEFTLSGTQSTFASSLNNPQALAFNSAGDLFEADLGSQQIYEFTLSGTQSTFAFSLNSPQGLAFNSAGDLFETDFTTGIIYKFTAGGKKTIFATGLIYPTGLAFDSAGDLFVAEDEGGRIFEFTNGVATAEGVFATGLNEPAALVFNGAGDLFEADGGSGKIYEFTPGGTRSTFATGLSPIGLAFDSLGNLFEADSGIIYEFTTNGVQSTFVSGLDYPTYLAFQPLMPAFSGLTASQSIPEDTAAITLGGTVSAPGPVYPAQGETITITINGNAQTTTINNSTGGFSLSYNPSAIPVRATPYTITYAYGGDNWLLALGSNLAATTDASTSLTVNKHTPSFSNLTASQSIPNDTTAITLAGTVSAPGPFYPAQGDTITVSINGNAQTTTINDAAGDFSFSYSPSTIPVNIAPYIITYSYAGDANFNSASNNTTTLTVYPAQNLFESDLGSQHLYEFTASGTQSTFASSLHNPQGLVFNSAGDLFEADATSGDINEFTSTGTQSTFAIGLGKTRGLAFNSAGTLFVADNGSSDIYEFTPSGVESTFASGLNGTGGLAFNSTGDLFLADEGSGNIYEFTPSGAKTTFASGLSEPAGLAFDSAGDLFEADGGTGKIYEFTNGVATEKGTFATGLNEPTGLAFGIAGTLYVANQGTSYDIYEFTTNGVQSTFASGLDAPTYLAFRPFTPAFSGLTTSQSIPYGTSAITLVGTVSAPGPVYPAQGETITITINGNAQVATINNSTGGFSLSYIPSTIPASATPYTITYAYGGDNWLLAQGSYMSATTTASTTLTVNKASLTVAASPQSKTYGHTLTFPASSTLFNAALSNNETIGSVTLVCSGGAVNAAVGSYSITPSAAIGGSGTEADYNIAYNPGTLTVNPLPVVLAGTRGYNGTATAAYGILSVSDKVDSDVVTVASGSATLAGAGVGTQAVTSGGTLALGGATATNYTVTGASGAVTITNPFNRFTVTSASLDVSGTNFVLCWQSVPGVVYTVLTNISLAPPQTWVAAGSPITATGTNTCFALPGSIAGNTNTFVVIKQ